MESFTDLRQVPDCLDQPHGNMSRMRAGKPDPLHAWHFVDRFEERGEIARPIVRRLIVIDDLAEELNFAMALPCRLHHFFDDVALRPHPFVAAGVRHYAERAELVAAL